LALGGSFENALVLDEQKVINGPLRFPDEFVRHKILDFVGDLSLLGHPLTGHFRAFKAGHNLHLQAVRFLLENPEYWKSD
jgi:UDP-3-O-[3-hydroxymyristoyl] N-acetylglucosamine deacetylase